MTEIEQIKATLDQINARLENIERILNALYVPVITEQQRQISTLPREQRKLAERDDPTEQNEGDHERSESMNRYERGWAECQPEEKARIERQKQKEMAKADDDIPRGGDPLGRFLCVSQ